MTIGLSAVIGLSMVISMLVHRSGKSSRPNRLMAARQTCAVFVHHSDDHNRCVRFLSFLGIATPLASSL
jgi:hypothetical protein